MREKQVLPVAVVGLTAALVAVVALWTLDRAGTTTQMVVTSDLAKGVARAGCRAGELCPTRKRGLRWAFAHQSLWCRRDRTRV